MLSVTEAFNKFQGRLETTTTENTAASSRQIRLRGQVKSKFSVVDDFLTGSYRRHTKTKPLRDVDMMFILGDRSHLDRHPSILLGEIVDVLKPFYGDHRVASDRRAVRVDFGTQLVDEVSGDVVSFDVVPAFTDGQNYRIPDDFLGEWIPTNPKVHAEKATAANQSYEGQWKPIVKMLKSWNNHQGKPLDPSFLIEVMSLDILQGNWGGSKPRECREFFSTAASRINEPWKDPAGLGPNVSDVLESDAAMVEKARDALIEAEKQCTEALRLDRAGRTGDALAKWQGLFGPAFAKS